MIGLFVKKKKLEVIARRRAHRTKNSAPANTTDTGETSKRGMRNDTATPQDTVTVYPSTPGAFKRGDC